MNHPEALLPDYALGLLSEREAAEVKAHLQTCSECRRELRALNRTLTQVVETLPPVSPPAGSWQKIQARLETPSNPASPSQAPAPPVPVFASGRPRLRWLVAAGMCVFLAVGALFWGYHNQQTYQQVTREQRTVAGWLSNPEVTPIPLQDRDGQRLGSVLVRPDGQALFVLRELPERGLAYQAWGHRDGDLVSLSVSQRPIFQVPWEAYESLYLSLEQIGRAHV